ncbi:YicC/YloC family endoribonuclease [Thermoactinomyces mirandus]|uniref:YicC family protein n=1 Tax=Thermoactinomyces mirandus TaxID=2756294 RepID=A0A7W1XSB8_9BACL|nr:YicC/YloC family endoribonuclease [Thermoactinomyces mirandus]MBA4602383.1 YicC family protein [Thermoactinomyces mirandus]
MDNNINVVSMTGYGRGETENGGIRIVTEIRTMNHRFLDMVIRLPHGWMSIEESIRKRVQSVIRRGRADVFVTIEGLLPPERKVEVDWGLLESFVQAGKILNEKWGVKADLTMADLLNKPELWLIEEVKPTVDAHHEAVLQTVETACQELKRMREQEGKLLGVDLLKRLDRLGKYVREMKVLAPKVSEHIGKKLRKRLEEWLAGADLDEERILTETAVWAEKADITEELTRLNSHISQFHQTMEKGESIGRKLDFLIQEMNREVNTIGSKANMQMISTFVVECKSELEKMKEQVQNIE